MAANRCIRTNVYRLAGDAHAEIAIDNSENWRRFGAALVGADIFAFMGNLYQVKPARLKPVPKIPTVLYRWDGATPVDVDTVEASLGPATYAGNGSGI